MSLLVVKVLKFPDFDTQDHQENLHVTENWYFEEELTEEEWRKAYLQSLQFASEKLPIEDRFVSKRMTGHLKAFSRKSTRTRFAKQHNSSEMRIISEILDAHGIPSDFKYIPLIESGIAADVSSHKGASGYWQFVPATARAYGLKVNSQVDERKDLHKSTHAAAKYLKALYSEFGNWVLVAAAYNTGDGNLRREIGRQGGERNYFKLKLNRETGNYVYKLIAVKEVIERPGEYIQTQNEKTWYAWEQPSGSQSEKSGLL